MNRRRFLQAALAGTGAALFSKHSRASENARPHYIVEICLSGGFDSLLTVDPKNASQCGTNIDCGYRPDEMIRGKRRLYGPLIGALVRHDEDLCLVHGVRVDTVAHDDGLRSLSRGKVAYGPSTPAIGDVLGSLLPGSAPIAHLSLRDFSGMMTPLKPGGYLPRAVIVPEDVSRRLVDPGAPPYVRPSWADTVAADRVQQARVLFATDPEQRSLYGVDAADAAALSRLLSTASRTTGFVDEMIGHRLELAVHAILNDHAKLISLGFNYLYFDSHTDNLHIQKQRLGPALADISRFIDILKSTRNAHGPLFDQTTIVIASELGRYPKNNAVRGKDHWPENSWIVLGKGIRKDAATIGATDAQFRGTDVDYRTGSTTAGDRRPMFVDTMYATLIHLAGGVPGQHGYPADSTLTCALS
jgi:Protein of unknown function (DUF1501)